MLMAYCGMTVVIMFGMSHPYRDKANRRMEFFNETIIMVCLYHLCVFTDFVSDPEVRYLVGDSFIYCTVVNLTVNLLMMCRGTFKKLRYLYKVVKKHIRVAREMQKRQKRYIKQ